MVAAFDLVHLVLNRMSMAGMILLSLLIGYPIFLLIVWAMIKLLFTPLDQVAFEQQNEKRVLLQKAKRIPARKRARNRAVNAPAEPVFVMPRLAHFEK